MNNTELTLDQLSEVGGGAPHITTWDGLAFKTSTNFLGPLGGESVFKPSTDPKGSVIIGDNHFRKINKFK